MATVSFRFYGELNYFLPPLHQKATLRLLVKQDQTTGVILKSLGVPVTDVDLILANGEPVDFTYAVRADDRISVYPKFHSIDIAPLNLINRTRLH